MGQRFYNLITKSIVWEVPLASGEGVRPPDIRDAKKAGADWSASVTTITDLIDKGEGLENWIVNLHLEACKGLHEVLERDYAKFAAAVRHRAKQERSKAPELGKKVHAAYEAYWRYVLNPTSPTPILDEEIKPYVTALHEFAQQFNMRPHLLEQVVINQEVGYAGTMDFLGEFNGALVVADYKTQNVKERPFWNDKFPLQLAAYAKANEVGKVAQLVSIIVDTSRHGTYELTGSLPEISFQVYSDIDNYFETFTYLAKAYYKLKKWKR